jgi:hypothetical protein
MITTEMTFILILIFTAYNPSRATDPSKTNLNFPLPPWTPIPTKPTSRYIIHHVLPFYPPLILQEEIDSRACQPANCHPSCSSSRMPMQLDMGKTPVLSRSRFWCFLASFRGWAPKGGWRKEAFHLILRDGMDLVTSDKTSQGGVSVCNECLG